MQCSHDSFSLLVQGAEHEQDGNRPASSGIYLSAAGGRRVPLLKVLQTTRCHGTCHYCELRAGRDVPRTSLDAPAMARRFLELHRAGRVEGLFLSSGLRGSADQSMQTMLGSAELIRRGGFRGYVHLKILPGASDAAVEQTLKFANRVSVNLEAPDAQALACLSPSKHFEELLGPLRTAAQLIREAGRRTSLTTQFVVGGAQESDAQVLGRADSLGIPRKQSVQKS